MSKLFVAPLICSSALMLLACGPNNTNSKALENSVQHTQNTLNQTFRIDTFAQFDEPWAVVVLPDQRLLITERKGQLELFDPKTKKNLNVQGIPTVSYGGQGGLGDVVLHPDFKNNHWIYLSYAVQGSGGYGAEIWSLGHRNPLGMAFDDQKQLWVVEMGPKGGDELNQILKGANYGYPIVSNGDHYSGLPIPDHKTRPEFKAPAIDWTPVISPSSMIIYTGDKFPLWQQKALIGGLSSKSIIVVDLKSQPVKEVQRLDMKQRIRGLQQAQDGSIWVIEDGPQAKLLKLNAN